MRRLPICVVVSLLSLLAACGGPKVDEGVIIAHEYDDEDVWTSETCGYRDPETNVCYVWNEHEHRDPERFLLRLRDCDGKTSATEVPESVYNRVRNGQRFSAKTGEVLPEKACPPEEG